MPFVAVQVHDTSCTVLVQSADTNLLDHIKLVGAVHIKKFERIEAIHFQNCDYTPGIIANATRRPDITPLFNLIEAAGWDMVTMSSGGMFTHYVFKKR